MATETVTAQEAPVWELKLRGMAQFYRECNEAGNTRKFFELYPPIVDPENPVEDDGDIEKTKQRLISRGPALKLKAADIVNASTKADIKSVGNGCVDQHSAETKEFETMTNSLKNEQKPDKNAWRAKLEANKVKMKAKSSEIIDQNNEKIINMINNLPEDQQDAAADLWGTIMSGFMVFWEAAVGKIVEIAQAIVNFLKEVWAEVEKAFNKVADCFVEAKDWLTSIF